MRAHVFLCMLAYYVEWHLREAWAPILFHDHRPRPAAGARFTRCPVQPSPAALRKRGRRRTDDGLPLSGFSDLMAHLATQTMNVIAVPGAKDAASPPSPIPQPCKTPHSDCSEPSTSCVQ